MKAFPPAPDGAETIGDQSRLRPPSEPMPAPYSAGFRQINLRFKGSILQVNLWYPAEVPTRTVMFGPYAMRVAVEAKPVAGKRRLIVISHGSKGTHFGHRDTALLLASHGYTVIAPLHPHDNYLDDSNSGTPLLWKDRPFHVRNAVDSILADSALGVQVDETAFGMVGFSLGGYTTLSLLGARPSVAALAQHLRRYPDDPLPVDPGAHGLPPDEVAQIAADHDAAFPDAYDPRFKSAVLLAPMCALFEDRAFDRVQARLSLYCAEKDAMLREPHHSHRLAKLLAKPPKFTVVPGAGHFSFLCPFPAPLQRELPELALDDDFDRPAFHTRLNREIEAFFSQTLMIHDQKENHVAFGGG
jgi:predicted dienelactone hydrolase